MSPKRRLLLGLVAGLVALVALEIALFANFPPLRAVFLQIAGLGVLAALGTVLARNLIHAALYLVAFFFLVACLFVLLEAEFLAAMQVLVYIGAVAILILFGIMLTRNIQGDETTGGAWFWKIPAALVSVAMLVLLIFGFYAEQGVAHGDSARPAWSAIRERPSLGSEGHVPAIAVNEMARGLGLEMMTRWVIPFEVAGLLLTASLIGAIALAMPDRPEESPRLGAIATIRPGESLDPAATSVPDEPLVLEEPLTISASASSPR